MKHITQNTLSRSFIFLIILIGTPLICTPIFCQEDTRNQLTTEELEKLEKLEAMADKAYDLGDYLEAIRYLNACIAIDSHPNYFIGLSVAYSKMGDCTNTKIFAQSAIDNPKIEEDDKKVAQKISADCVNAQGEDSSPPWVGYVGYPLLIIGTVGFTYVFASDLSLKSDKEDFVRANNANGLTLEQFEQQRKELDKREIAFPLEVTLYTGTIVGTLAGGVLVYLYHTNTESTPTFKQPPSSEGTMRLVPLLEPNNVGLIFEAIF